MYSTLLLFVQIYNRSTNHNLFNFFCLHIAGSPRLWNSKGVDAGTSARDRSQCWGPESRCSARNTQGKAMWPVELVQGTSRWIREHLTNGRHRTFTIGHPVLQGSRPCAKRDGRAAGRCRASFQERAFGPDSARGSDFRRVRICAKSCLYFCFSKCNGHPVYTSYIIWAHTVKSPYIVLMHCTIFKWSLV